MGSSSSAHDAILAVPTSLQEREAADKTHRPRCRKLVGFLIVLVLLVPFTAGFERAGVPMDEGLLLVYPELIGHGALPYRDFETVYAPANIYALATIYSLFGTDVMVERAVGLFYRALILSLLFVLIARWNVAVAVSCCALAAWVLLEAEIVAYAWFGGLTCLLGSLWLMAGVKPHARHFWAGLLGGCALLYRVDLASAVFLSALPLLYQASADQRVRYFTGMTLGLIPLGLLACWVGPSNLINNLFLYPVVYCNAARHLPWSTIETYIRALFIIHLLAAGLNLVAGIIAVRTRPGELRNWLLLSLALLGAMITAQAAQRLDLPHLTYAAFFAIGTLPLSLLVLAKGNGEWHLTLGQACLAAIIVFAVTETVGPQLTDFAMTEWHAALFPSEDDGYFVQHAGRSFPLPSRGEAINVSRMLDWLENEAAVDERLFVGPADLRRTNYCDTYLYHLMPKLRPSGYFLEMNPFSANRPGSRLASDVLSANWLVLNRALDKWSEQNRSLEFQSDEANQVVRENFQLAAKFGPYLVFHRKG